MVPSTMLTDLDALAARAIDRTPIASDAPEVAVLGARWTIDAGELHLKLAGPMRRTGGVAAFAGALADTLDHHPKIVLEYAGLTLAIHTHDAKAITTLDLVYAARLEQWLRTNAW